MKKELRYDKTPATSRPGEEAKCPKCGNSFYITGSKCYTCGYGH